MPEQRLLPVHDDIQGVLGTDISGGAQWTPTAYRSTGIVFNEVQSADFFTMVFQLTHRKALGTPLDSVHLHFVPKAAQDGNIRFAYEWGWYNHDDVIPATLPNTGNSADIALVVADQYKQKVSSILTGLAAPTSEVYSSILYVRLTAAAPGAGINWWAAGGTNRIALVYMDAHFITDRNGSWLEYTDA